MLLLTQLIQDRSHQTPRVPRIGLHMSHDHLHRDALVGRVPAIIIRRHADHAVRNFGLTGKLGFGKGRHIDDAATPAAVEIALSAGTELRTLCIVEGC